MLSKYSIIFFLLANFWHLVVLQETIINDAYISTAHGLANLSSTTWAGAGPVPLNTINEAIAEAIKTAHFHASKDTTSTDAYLKMKKAFDDLPRDQKEAARNQIDDACQRALDRIPDSCSLSYRIRKDLRGFMKNIEDAYQESRNEELQEAIKFNADFLKEIGEKFGAKAEKLAKELAEKAKGKRIRNVDEALKSYEKFKDSIDKKFGRLDKLAITKALESVNLREIGKSLKQFSKAAGLTSLAIDAKDLVEEFRKAQDTGNWRPFYVKAETDLASYGATAATAFAFSLVAGTPVGILGYAVIVTSVGVLVDDEMVEKVNHFIGI